jgi:hypothetical protein
MKNLTIELKCRSLPSEEFLKTTVYFRKIEA